jgi:uncharacterized membrane protein YqjE
MKDPLSFSQPESAGAGESRLDSGRSITQILQEIVTRVGEIIRSEFKLATIEVKQDLSERTKAATLLGAAGVLVVLALGLLLLSAVYGLSTVVAPWLAALIVGVAVGVIGGILLYVGQARMKQSPKLEMTTQTAEDNIRWLKNQSK